jgi:dTDP-4-dehydrorhamnose 3,5-epimerase
MTITQTALSSLAIIEPRKFIDTRGYFAEVFSERALLEVTGGLRFVQDNVSFSASRGTVRGLHYQVGQSAQAKLIRVLRGSIIDVVVDVRRSSPTFGQSEAIELSADNFRLLYIPAGFAHGFETLVDGVEVHYKVSAYYSPKDERGLLWNDPALKIGWRTDPKVAIISDKDQILPTLANAADLFE